MQTTTEEGVVIQKTRELCQAILEQSDFQTIRRRIDTFMTDEQAKQLYQTVVEKGEALNQKQHLGVPVSQEEITDFENRRDALFDNSVAKDFLDAQQELHKVQESVNQYVAKTLELGRVPQPEDFDSGSCGHGCGCHH